MTSTAPVEVVKELVRRTEAGDYAAMDELIAEAMVNHAAGPQGRAGWRAIVEMIDHDIADLVVEHHHFVGERDLVSHHMTMRGRHRASTMPLWSGALAQGQQVAWRFMHLWRVQDGQIVEHWACRDDLGLLAQVGLWHRPQTDETGDGR